MQGLGLRSSRVWRLGLKVLGLRALAACFRFDVVC